MYIRDVPCSKFSKDLADVCYALVRPVVTQRVSRSTRNRVLPIAHQAHNYEVGSLCFPSVRCFAQTTRMWRHTKDTRTSVTFKPLQHRHEGTAGQQKSSSPSTPGFGTARDEISRRSFASLAERTKFERWPLLPWIPSTSSANKNWLKKEDLA